LELRIVQTYWILPSFVQEGKPSTRRQIKAVLTPNRFDKLLYLGVSETHDAQLKIIEALTRKFRLDPNLDLMTIAEQCPFNYTGADFYALCSDAMLKAMSRKAAAVDTKIGMFKRCTSH